MGESRGIRILTAVGLSVALVGARGLGPAAVVGVYVAVVTLPLIVTDVRERRLPNALVLPGYVVAGARVVGEVLAAVARGSPGSAGSVGEQVVAGFCALGLLGVLAAGGGMGMGDVKLGGLLGIALGDVVSVAVWLGGAFATLLVVGGVDGVAGGRRGRTEVAFGPILLGSFWPVLLLA